MIFIAPVNNDTIINDNVTNIVSVGGSHEIYR